MAVSPFPAEGGASLPLSCFFAHDAHDAASLPRLPAGNVLLCGPPRSGKTTLLFHACSRAAGASPAARATLLARRSALEASPPLVAPEKAPPGDALSRVDVRYLETDADLRKWCANSHLLSDQPSLIGVDDLSSFVDAGHKGDRRARDAALARTIACLHDAAAHASARLAAAAAAAAGCTDCTDGSLGTPRCQLVVAEKASESGDGPPSLFVYQRWFQSILSLRHAAPGDDAAGAAAGGNGLVMSLLPKQGATTTMKAVRYSITPCALLLDGLA